MLELLFLIGVLYYISENMGEEALSWAIGILLVLLIIGLASAGRKSDRAYVNFIDYWEKGGPDREGYAVERRSTRNIQYRSGTGGRSGRVAETETRDISDRGQDQVRRDRRRLHVDPGHDG